MTAHAMTTTSAIEVRGLRKSYGKQVVLDGIDLDVPEGTVFALLGPNGAGKTTVIHILSTLIAADAGEVRIAGFDVAREPDAIRGVIGLTGQVSAVDGQFTGEENLRLMADLEHLGKERGQRRVAELLERFELVADAGKPAATYSGGMRRRLDLAMTLVGDPRIIFLDEPTTGLDPRSRRVMWDIVRELVAGGVTILLTTQYLEEADRLASRIALLDAGRIVAQGTPAELKRLVPGGSVRLEFSDAAMLDRAAGALHGAIPRRPEPGPPGAQRRRRALASGPARPAGRRGHRGRGAGHPVRGSRRRVPVPHRPRERPTRRQEGAGMTAYMLTDSTTMLRRSLRRMRRYPSLTFFIAVIPVLLLLLFVYVFGGMLGAGLGGPGQPAGPAGAAVGREAYLAYIIPGILLMTAVGAGQGTAITVAMDMTAGIIARFRTMSIARGAVLGGHVFGSVIQTAIAMLIVIVVALLVGFRPTTEPLSWLAALGLLALTSIAVSWLSVGMGMVTGSVETASNIPMILTLLVFLSSAFVPTASMPDPLRWFAEHQPFTPIAETLRGLLFGTPIGDSGIVAVAWCVVISVGGYLWARRLYERAPMRVAA